MKGYNRVFCRMYQLIFRLAMPLLPYREPKWLDSVSEIAEELQRKQIDTVLLITDRFLRNNGATDKLEASLLAAQIRCIVFDGVQANPTVENVEEAVSLYRRNGCCVLIAFGGGSAADCVGSLRSVRLSETS